MQASAPNRLSAWPLLLALLGLLLLGLGLCLACLSLSIALDPPQGASTTTLSWLIFFVFIALPVLGSGVGALLFAWQRRKQERVQRLQQMVLALASARGGSVTATDLAMESPLPLTGAQDYLEGLASRGICRMEMSADGTTHFVFHSAPDALAP